MAASRWTKLLQNHGADMLQLLLLLLAISLADKFSEKDWPVMAYVVPLVCALLMGPKGADSGSPLGELRRGLPRLIVITVVALGVHVGWLGLGADSWLFAPLWWLGGYVAGLLLSPPCREQLTKSGFAQWLIRRASAGPDCTFGGLLTAIGADIVLCEISLVALSGYYISAYLPTLWQGWGPVLLLIGVWSILRLLLNPAVTRCHPGSGIPLAQITFEAVAVALATTIAAGTLKWGSQHAAIALWVAAGMATLNLIASRYRSAPNTRGEELLRLQILLLCGAWLMHGFASYKRHGAGDAAWYATMLSDMVGQLREGIFPVWAGQTEYQFNGSIYPLRIAPLFHHLGALLDVATFQSLGIYALQNALLTLVGLAGLFSCYLSLRALAPAKSWLALVLSIVFLASPGVLGVAYNNDLYMSWTALPWLPLVWSGTMKSFEQPSRSRPLILSFAALGLCWWAHTPIAVWTTLLVAIMHLGRLVLCQQRVVALRQCLVCAPAFLLVAAYPLVSVLLYPPEMGTASSFQEATAGNILHFLKEVFPAVLLPLSDKGRALSDFQLGYSLWFAAIFSCVQVLRRPTVESALLTILGFSLILLLIPLPGVTGGLWSFIPDVVRDTTGNWVMNRLYLVLSIIIVTAFIWVQRGRSLPVPLVAILSLVAIAWSLFEARKFHVVSHIQMNVTGALASEIPPETAMVTRFSYLAFPAVPDNFTNGATDPLLEHRILSKDFASVLVDNGEAALATAKPLHTRTLLNQTATVGAWELDTGVPLEPKQRQLHVWNFGSGAISGVLYYNAEELMLAYQLPEYGGATSFGVGGDHRNWLGIRSTVKPSQEVSVRLLPQGEIQAAPRLNVLQVDETLLPVRVLSWAPYVVELDSPGEGWLESTRMYQRFYHAEVNGVRAETAKSPRGYVAIQVPNGASEVRLRFVPPAGLWLSYTLSLATIVTFLAYLLRFSSAGAREPAPPIRA